MSTEVEAAAPARRLAPLDRWHDRLASTPRRAQVLRWAGPVGVTLLAAGTRLYNLGQPDTLVFDETFYVKDAYTLLNLGYEASWPDNPNPAFEAGDVDTFTSAASFVVHPPLGKWLISLGFLAFGGAENPVSWRIATAMVGILAVILLMLVAHKLFASPLVTTIAGLLMAVDGNAIVMSRVALLDNFVMFFALLGFGAILLDREWTAVRMAAWVGAGGDRGRGGGLGPVLWWRPWLLAAGVLFGLTAAIKWSGLYFLAIFAVYTLVVDALARRAAGLPFWLTGTILKQAPASFVLTVPLAIAAYMVTWTGWFVTDGGYDRTWAEEPGNAWTGGLSWVPLPLQSFWHFETQVYNYHVNERSSHPYAANPLTWLLMVRPTSMFFLGSNRGENGCSYDFCGQSITGIANPLIWWAATAAVLYLVWRLVKYREWRVGLILTGVAAGYLPWLLYLDRTVYQFYTIAFEPYLILALVFVLSQFLGTRDDHPDDRRRGSLMIAGFLAAVIAVSVFFWPLWVGQQENWPYIVAHYWLPTWR